MNEAQNPSNERNTMRTVKRPVGTAETFAVGDRVVKVEGIQNLGHTGTVTRVLGEVGGDVLIEVDGAWTCYDRQLESVA